MKDSKTVQITHLGGEHCVTGSCHLLQAQGLNILVDCGMVQGRDAVLPMSSWPVKPSEIDFLFLTHAHIDHIGRIPELIGEGFKGEILCTHPTKDLLLPMLDDALSFSDLSEREKDRLQVRLDKLSWGFEYGSPFDLQKGIRFRLQRAGHILGSCSICLEGPDTDWSVCFSGDLGARHTPLLPDPDPAPTCGTLILESTYGDSFHESREHRVERLGKVLAQALADRGKVLIPAFALGRTQELIYEIDRLLASKGMEFLSKVPVLVDSPLALDLTDITGKLKQYWDEEAKKLLRQGDHPMDFDRLYAVRKHGDHLKILEMQGPAIIIAGSGMCSGGRILDHLRAGLENPKTDILFVGYQADGTLGRDIVDASQKPGSFVQVEWERYNLRARVHVLGGYSAHADQRELIQWVESMPRKPERIKLVHGENDARRVLGEALSRRGYTVEA
jgi:metallo-beta-lactamase family protein